MPTSCSACSSGCTPPTSTKEPASGWPWCSGSSSAMAVASGPRPNLTAGRRFLSRFKARRANMSDHQVQILLVDDNPSDVKLALHAFKTHNLANAVHVVRDGAEA